MFSCILGNVGKFEGEVAFWGIGKTKRGWTRATLVVNRGSIKHDNCWGHRWMGDRQARLKEEVGWVFIEHRLQAIQNIIVKNVGYYN